MYSISRLAGIILAALLVFVSGPIPPASASIWQDKVDPWVLQSGEVAADNQVEFLVYLAEQADLNPAAQMTSKAAQGEFVFKALTETARRTQASLLQELQEQGIPHRSYWIANMIWVRGDVRLVQNLAQRRDVAYIHANPQVRGAQLDQAVPLTETNGIEWNIAKVGAPLVWTAGYTGQGVVVGGQDTGYEWEHPALINQYRGWDGSQADHRYSWHDAIHEDLGSPGDNVCGLDSPTPCDDYGHGTHTMGTMVGDDGADKQIGVAPGARWIGCRNMENGVGTPATYSECYEWFVAPYPPGASSLEGNPSMAPDIINNSWGCPPSEGCTNPDVLLAVVENVRAAGILTVHSAGNSGPSCGTVNTPAAIYDASFSVGNLTSEDLIASSSSRGPVMVDESGRLKPDISAPGTNIYSSYLGGTYRSSSGTSMAAPHVAGVAALILSIDPRLSGQVNQLEQVLTSTAKGLTSTQECGGVPGDRIPNNTYGHGRVDAYEAMKALEHSFDLSVNTQFPYVLPGGLVHYEIQLTHLNALCPTDNVILIADFPPGTISETRSIPYTRKGNSLQWDFVSLAADESLVLSVDLRVPDRFSLGTMIESTFWVSSDQVVEPVSILGPPVMVVMPLYLPLVSIVE